jgi:FkbM family methyltransferase
MPVKELIKRIYIKTGRYFFAKQFMKVMAGPLKGYLWTTRSSYEYILGDYEDPQVQETFLSWLTPETVFYDLGANVGYYALLANRVISAGKIYAFEPIPASRAVFEQHIAINKKQLQHNNIEILPFGISDSEKEMSFSNNPGQQDGNTYIRSSGNYTEAEDTVTVQCFSIDELVARGWAAPDVIKIDVEGAEYDVLRGAIQTLRKYRPAILLATHDYHLPGVKDLCTRFLQELGYTLQHTGSHNKQVPGLDDYIAVHPGRS